MDYVYLSNLTWTCSDLSLSQTQAVNSVRLGITSLGIETEESVKFSRPITSNCGCVVWATAHTPLHPQFLVQTNRSDEWVDGRTYARRYVHTDRWNME
mgnify:CR=1 FL=1